MTDKYAPDRDRSAHSDTASLPVIPAEGFAAICFAPRLQRRVIWAIVLFSLTASLLIWASVADKNHAPAWLAFLASITCLAYVLFSLFLWRRHAIPMPQIFLDRHGVLKLGVWDWDQHRWSDLSDFIVCAQDDDGSTTHYLLAFAVGEEVPKGEWKRYRRAKLRLRLPYLQTDRSGEEAIYNSVRDWLNEWRRHALTDGPWPHPHHLRRVEGRFPITALSEAEHERWWKVFEVRYPGIRRPAAGAP